MDSPREGVFTAPVRAADTGRIRPLTAGLLVLLAGAAGVLPSFSLGANVLVLGSGGVLFWTGLNHAPPRRVVAVPARAAAWWLVPAGLLLVVEATNYVLGSTYEHPTLSGLADPWLERYPVRAAAFLGWLAAFRVLVRR
jgi:hypothetical protein